jgi:hypothetical protein
MLTKEKIKSLRSQIEWIMGQVHVGESDEFVTAEANRRLDIAAENGTLYTAKEREKIVALFIEAHRKNQGFYSYVMGGLR